MSPEQVLGDAVDQRSDIFSLGVVLYEMLTGGLPFPAEHPQATIYGILNTPPRIRELSATAPPPVVETVRRCLAKTPSGRPADAGALAAELARPRSSRAPSSSGGDELPSLPVLDFSETILEPPTIPELALSVRRPVPFVGRDKELGRLEDLMRAAVGGEGRVVFVSGEPGIGKTALVTELVRRACPPLTPR